MGQKEHRPKMLQVKSKSPENREAVFETQRESRTCPPCAEGTPDWIVKVRDRWIETGKVSLTEIEQRLAIGERLVGPESEFYHIDKNTIGIRNIPDDPMRPWRIESANWPTVSG